MPRRKARWARRSTLPSICRWWILKTNLVIRDGEIHQRLDAFAAAMAELPAPWRFAAVFRHLPQVLKDVTKPIARNRYRIFGRTDACLIPDASLKARFLELT